MLLIKSRHVCYVRIITVLKSPTVVHRTAYVGSKFLCKYDREKNENLYESLCACSERYVHVMSTVRWSK